ncbi:uncharacterized protein METZ01_LOCUS386720, partial [marine metagenome]
MKALHTLLIVGLLGSLFPTRAALQAGALVVDATPKQLPVHVNGGMRQRELGEVGSPIKVRAIALDDGL